MNGKRFILNDARNWRFSSATQHHEAHAPEAKQADNQDGETCRIVPCFNSSRAVSRADPNQNSCADDVANEGENDADDDKKNPARHAKGIKFAKKKRNHESGLKRTDTTASFFNSNKARTNFDDVAVLQSRHPGELKEDYI